MKLTYGNALAVHDPDPVALAEIGRRLAVAWPEACISRAAPGWLLAVADVGPAASAATTVMPGTAGATVVFVEDAQGRTDAAAITAARPDDVRVAGDVTAIGVRGDGSGVRVVRSCAGTVPVYIARQGSRVAVSTMVGPLVAAILDQVKIDPLGLAAWTSGYAFFPDGRTWLADVTALPVGHAADLDRDGSLRQARYWDPRPDRIARPTPASRAEHVEALRDAVLSCLARTLDGAGRNLLTLSGGADSSLLAYLIAGHFRAGLSTLSFRSPAPGEAAIEERMIRLFATAHPPRNQWVFGSSMPERLALLQGVAPSPFPLLHPALQLLPSLAAQAPITVLVGGEFADHVAGGVHHEADWFEQTSPSALIVAMTSGRLPSGARDAARWVKRRIVQRSLAPLTTARAAGFLAPAIRKEFAEWAARRDGRLAGDPRPWRHFAARMELEQGAIAMNWEACSRSGVLRVMPFLSRATLENLYVCHASELIGPGVKRLIRAGFVGDAPPEHLSRTKYRGFDAVHPPVAVHPVSEAAPLIDPAATGPFDGVEGLMVAVMNNLVQGLAARIRDKSQ